MKKQPSSSIGIAVHGTASRDTIAEARSAINDVLACGMDQSTIVVALNVLSTLCHGGPVSLNQCSVHQPQEKN